MKVGSLFAGIGGFDLGFERAGFEVAWCVEWDKNAQAVLRKRFPNAQVYGDIREVDPDKLERVDVICGGFPCQDLSVAGKRAGLAGERSGLFHDAMRIVRQLRPSVLILENVPGLLSSNRGLDFATVLREVGEGWHCSEVGWRVLDSQYFGVAQRRRRVFVVAGSRAGCAEQILALAEGGGGDPPSRHKARQGTSSDAARSVDVSRIVPMLKKTDIHSVAFRKSRRAQTEDDDETLVDDGLANTLNGFDTGDTRTTHVICQKCGHSHAEERVCVECGNDLACDTLELCSDCLQEDAGKRAQTIAFHPTQDPISSAERTHAHAVAHAFYSTGGSHGLEATPELSPPLKVGSALGIPSPPAVAVSFDWQKGNDVNNPRASTMNVSVEQTQTLSTTRLPAVAFSCKDHGADASAVAPTMRAMPHRQSHQNGGGQIAVAFKVGNSSKARSDGLAVEQSPTLGSSAGGNTVPAVCASTIVRRLTPVECERLQGFPDGWTQIGTDKPTADTHRYKQLGNAVTVNVAEWIARRTMAWLVSL